MVLEKFDFPHVDVVYIESQTSVEPRVDDRPALIYAWATYVISYGTALFTSAYDYWG